MESSNYEKQNFYGNILDSDADSSHYSDMQEILNNYRPQVFEQASIPSGSYTTESIVYDSYSGYAYNDSGDSSTWLPGASHAQRVFDKFYWSSTFHEIHEHYVSLINSPDHPSNNSKETDESILNAYFQLSAHAADFTAMAEKFAKIIISEKYLDNDKKTIKPVDVGGIAGGEKYICQGILLKFAVDSSGIYGSDDNASKAAGHDLRGLNLYYQCNIPNMFVPLMCLIDYKGFRMLAISLLPIDSSKTLKYGSADGGKTVYADENVDRKMEQAARILNLQRHLVGAGLQAKHLYSTADLEGHVLEDGKLVLLDFARVMPPEPPLKENRKAILYRMLRPELVKKSPVPISPDTFSRFEEHDPDKRVHAKHVRELWKGMINKEIPTFAKMLLAQEDSLLKLWTQPRSSDSTDRILREVEGVISKLHKCGINLRYLNLLRYHLCRNRSQLWSKLIFTEMVARTVKVNLNQALRHAMSLWQLPSEERYRKLVVDFMNVVLGNSTASVEYWQHRLSQAVHQKYCYFIYEQEEEADHFTTCRLCLSLPKCEQSMVDKWLLYRRLSRLLPVQFSTSSLHELDKHSEFDMEAPLSDVDVIGLTAKVKNMPIIDKGKAFMLYKQAKTSRKSLAAKLFKRAIEKFELIGEVLPDGLTYHYWANALRKLAKLTLHDGDSVNLLIHSFNKFKRIPAGFSSSAYKSWRKALHQLEDLMINSDEWQELWAKEFEVWFKNECGKAIDTDASAIVELADQFADTALKMVDWEQGPQLERLFYIAVQTYKKAIDLDPALLSSRIKLAHLLSRRSVLYSELPIFNRMSWFAQQIYQNALLRCEESELMTLKATIRKEWVSGTTTPRGTFPEGEIDALQSPLIADDILFTFCDDGNGFEAIDLMELRLPDHAFEFDLDSPSSNLKFSFYTNERGKLMRRYDDLLFVCGETFIQVWLISAIAKVLRTSVMNNLVPYKTLTGFDDGITCMCLSNHGYLCVASTDTIRIWMLGEPNTILTHYTTKFKNLAKFKIPRQDQSNSGPISLLACHEHLLFVVIRNVIQVWNLTDTSNIVLAGKLELFEGMRNVMMKDIIFNSKGNFFVLDNRNIVSCFELRKSDHNTISIKPIQVVNLGDSFFHWFALFSDNIITITTNSFSVYDSFSMNKIYTIKAHSGNINAACISKDGVLLTQSNDKETKLWKLVDCSWLSNPLQTNNKHNAIIWDPKRVEPAYSSGILPRNVTAAVFSSKHNVVFIACNDLLLTWCLQQEKVISRIQDEHTDLISSMVLNEDETMLITASHDCTIKIWRVHNQKLELDSTYSAHKSKIYDLLLVGSTLCSASEEGTIKIWKIETDEHKQKYQLVHQQTFKGHQNSVLSLAYFNGFLLSGDASGYLKVWHLQSRKLVGTCHICNRRIGAIAISPSRNLLFVGESTKYSSLNEFKLKGNVAHIIKVFDISQFPIISHFKDLNLHTGSVLTLAATDSYLVSSGRDNTIALTCLHDWECKHKIRVQAYAPLIEIAEDLIVTSDYNRLIIYRDAYYWNFKNLISPVLQ